MRPNSVSETLSEKSNQRNPIREIQRKYPIDWVAGEPYTLKSVSTVLGRGTSETASESWYGVFVPISWCPYGLRRGMNETANESWYGVFVLTSWCTSLHNFRRCVGLSQKVHNWHEIIVIKNRKRIQQSLSQKL